MASNTEHLVKIKLTRTGLQGKLDNRYTISFNELCLVKVQGQKYGGSNSLPLVCKLSLLTIIQGVSKYMQLINMIIIYYWNKCNGRHLEHVKNVSFKQETSNQFFFWLLLKFFWLLLKLATVVEGNPKVRFSIATTPRCKEGRYSFPCIAPLYPWKRTL